MTLKRVVGDVQSQYLYFICPHPERVGVLLLGPLGFTLYTGLKFDPRSEENFFLKFN